MAAPLSAIPAPRDDKGHVIRALAGRVGRVLGAASACPNVARPRIKGISDKITDVIKSSSAGEDESRSVMGLFNGGYLEGARAVNTKQTDCATADRELADLESVSSPESAPQMNAMTRAAVHGLRDEGRGWTNSRRDGPRNPLWHIRSVLRTGERPWSADAHRH